MKLREPRLLPLIPLLLGGCSVGPDYDRPEVELPEQFLNEAGVAAEEGVEIATLWQSLGIADLDRLIAIALTNNTTIAQALAALDETRALSGLAVYSYFPAVGTSAEFERSRQSAEDPFAFQGQGVVERYRAGFDAAWEIDLFGSLRRQSERIQYLAQADEASLYATEIAIIAEVAQAYFEWVGETLRLTLLRENLENQAESVSILQAGLDAGRGTALDVARARAVERSLAANEPLAAAGVARAEQRLAVLTGVPANTLRAQISMPREMPPLPGLVVVGSPAEWLARRPDVRAAERQLGAATAGIGIEVAEYYPKLDLVGSFGWTGQSGSAIGDSDADRWRFAPGLSWRILDFGRIGQSVQAAEARAAGAFAAFEETWLLAIEETENALANYAAASERVDRLQAAVGEGTEAARLARLRFDVGADGYLSVLDAERTKIDLDDQLALAMTDRATALAALYKALGGDFAVADERPDPVDDDS